MPAICDAPGRFMEVRCAPCGRYGRYSVTGLARRYGEHTNVHDIYRRLVASCRAEGTCRAVMDVEAGVRAPNNPWSRA